MFCSKCGTENPANAHFCAKCGTQLPTAASIPAPENSAPPPPSVISQPEYSAPQQASDAAPQQPYQQQPDAQMGFIGDVYSKTFGFLFKKPIRLWGLSLLASLLSFLAIVLSLLPIIWIPIIMILGLGMVNIFLCGFRGQDISVTQLVEGFKKDSFLRNIGGIAWMWLWIFIWALIPIVGPIFAIIKMYSYRFVPYILLSDHEITAAAALKKSIAQTQGYKGSMFLSDLLIVIGLVILSLIFFLFSSIPYLGKLVAGLYILAYNAFTPLIFGILGAVYYDKISEENPM